MSAEEGQQPSLLEQLATDAAKQAAERATKELAKKALLKIGAVLSAKGAAIVAAVVAVIVLIVLLIVLIVSVAGAAFQSSTTVWPVPVATDSAGNYRASGWTISSRYGWRDNPTGSGVEFHDGIDLANPQGTCPFGYHCGAPSIFDGTVTYVGWDQAASGDPSKDGGGMVVIVENGYQDHQTVYAHLEPYRLYVQLQGRIEDEYGRYDAYSGYQPIGTGELQPDLANSGIEMTCLNDMPNFIPTRSGPGTVVFLYDRPADCTTTVVWSAHGDGWQGWIPDDPGGRWGDEQRADLRWQTPIDPGKRAKDVALRFRAHLVPPPPPPTEVPTDTTALTPEPGGPTPTPAPQAFRGQLAGGQGSVAVSDPGGSVRTSTPLSASGNVLPTPFARTGKPRSCAPLAGGWTRCTWASADIPTERERFAAAPDPWVVAARRDTSTQVLDDHDPDAAGPTVLPAQLLPSIRGTPTPLRGSPTPTTTPARTRLRVQTPPFGGRAPPALRQDAPTPTPSPDILPTPPPMPGGGGDPLPTPESTPSSPGRGPGDGPDCSPLALVRLPDVTAPNPRLVEPAATSFAAVRVEILDRTGVDALAVLADVLRQPSFTTNKPGVLQTSWHKAGRAIDLNQGGPFVRVPEGRKFRLYVNNVDITAIFEVHGWQRIPAQGDTLEWWHYEWHPDNIAWISAILQVWDIPTLQAAFPDINWTAIGCVGGSNGSSDPEINPQETEEMCVLGLPSYRSTIETFAGCGPPVRAGTKVYQLDSTLGFVGLTGRTTGPHLHLGLKVKNYEDFWPYLNICTPDWLQGRTPSPDAYCYTDMADPLAFLPQAPGNNTTEEGDPANQAAPAAAAMWMSAANGKPGNGPTPTTIIPEGAPYQLPPPNYPNSLVFTPVPDATPVGQYWSPYADGGQYGGDDVGKWFCTNVWSGFPRCN